MTDTLAQTIPDEFVALKRRVHNDLARAEQDGVLDRVRGWTAPVTYGELDDLLRLLEQRTQERDDLAQEINRRLAADDRAILGWQEARERVRELEAALHQYGDARHWAIHRVDFDFPRTVWIGPGAEEKPYPNPTKVAREALRDGDREQEPRP